MTSTPYGPQPPPAQSSLSFTQGFLLGQLSVVLLIGAFIKFFIFGEPPRSESRGQPQSQQHTRKRSNSINVFSKDAGTRTLREKQSVSNILRAVPSSSTNTPSILRKTYYNAVPAQPASKNGRHRPHHSSHQPESLDWFNVLIAQTISQYRQTAYMLKDSPTSSIVASLAATINDPEKKPSFIDEIKVTDISLGEEFPIFSNCRVIAIDDAASDGDRLQALMDVDVSDDNLSLAIETSLLVNYPKPRSAVLPVALSVSVVRLCGTLCISLIPAPSDSSNTFPQSAAPQADGQPETQFPSSSSPHDAAHSPSADDRPASSDSTGTSTGIPNTSLAFSFLPDYKLDLSVRSLIGSRSRLQDMPKVAQLVEARVRAWFEERVVEPRVQVVALPGLWPRMGRTGVREQEDAENGSEDDYNTGTNATMSGAGTYTQDGTKGTDMEEGLRFRGDGGDDVAANTIYGHSSDRQEGSQEDRYRIPGALPQ